MEAILQTASDFVVDTGRDTLDTAAAGETTGGGGGVSFCVPSGFFDVPIWRSHDRTFVATAGREKERKKLTEWLVSLHSERKRPSSAIIALNSA